MYAPRRMLSPIALSTLALALTVLPALAGAWQGREETRDGVLHVMNPAEPMNPKVTLKPTELWRIGGDTEAEGEFFGVINQVISDAEGNIYLLDFQLNEIKIFAPDGTYLRTIGREGEGPGEFRTPAGLFFVPTGEVGVLQAAPLKIVLLTKQGEPAGEYPTPKIEGEGFLSVSGAQLAGKQLVCMAQVNNFNQEKGTFTQTMHLCGVDNQGKVVASYHQEPRLWEFANPVISEEKWDTIQNRWATADDGRVFGCTDHAGYEVRVWNPDGSLDRVIHAEHTPHKRTADEHAKIESVWSAFTRQAPNSKLEIRDHDKSISAIFTRPDGSLWVLDSQGSRVPAGTIGSFDVFDRQGRFVKEVVLQGEGNPQEDGYFFVGDRLYVVTEFLSAFLAMQGGAEGEVSTEDPEPMAVICYQLDASQIALN